MMKRFACLLSICCFMGLILAMPVSAKIKLNFAGHYPEEHPSTKLLRKAVQEVKDKTEGRVEIKLFPGDQLGDYTLLFQDIMMGSVDMGQVNLPSEYDVRLEAHSIPYIVKAYDDIPKIFSYDSNFSRTFKDLLAKKNIEFFGFNVIGLIGVGSKVKPENPFDPTADKKILIRVPPMKVYQLSAKALNYRTTTINWADIYSAMQTGVCDGWIGGTPDVNYLTFRDVEKYYVAYNNFVECNAFLMAKYVYKRLGSDGPIVRDIFKATAAASFKMAKVQDDYYLKKMAEAGITVISPTPEQAKTLSDYIHETVWPKLYDLYGKEIFDSIKKDLGEQ